MFHVSDFRLGRLVTGRWDFKAWTKKKLAILCWRDRRYALCFDADDQTYLHKVLLGIHWRLSTILKRTLKVCEVMFFPICKGMYIYSESLFNTLYTEIKPNVKNVSFGEVKVTKNALFFLRELKLITVLLLIHNLYTSWSTWFISFKLCTWDFLFSIPSRFY